MRKLIIWLNTILAKIETFFLIIILLTMILLAFLQVILRNFFSTSILWGDTVLRHLVLWIAFIGASLATKESRHINIDALSRLLSQSTKRVIGIIVNLFASAVCLCLLKASIIFLQSEKASGSTLFAAIPTWLFQIVIAIGFGLMTLRFLIHVFENILHSKLPEQEAQP